MSEDRHWQLAAIEPGQIWLVEQDVATGLSPLERSAVTSANVVLYDRALAPLLAGVLPLGSYAEKLPLDAHAVLSPRALAFAADGWSVVQLIARAGRRARLAGAATALSGGAADLPVRVIAKSDAPGSRRGDCLPDLAALIDEMGDDEPLTLVFGPRAGRPPAQSQAFTANGLAG